MTVLSTLYGAVLLSSMLLPPLLIRTLGCKWTIVLSMGCYVAFSLGNFYASWYPGPRRPPGRQHPFAPAPAQNELGFGTARVRLAPSPPRLPGPLCPLLRPGWASLGAGTFGAPVTPENPRCPGWVSGGQWGGDPHPQHSGRGPT